MTRLNRSDRTPETPWWRPRPRLGAAAVTGVFAGVVALRLADPNVHDGIALLAVLPIAGAALLFGRRAGGLAGVGGLAFLAGWGIAEGVALSPWAWIALALPMVVVGVVAGLAGQAIAAAAGFRRVVCDARRRQQGTTERTESVVQSLVAAKWSFEAGRIDEGLVVLTDAIGAAEQVVVDLVRMPGPPADPFARGRSAVDLTGLRPPSTPRPVPPG